MDDYFIRPDNDTEPTAPEFTALADEYQAGLDKAIASGYEEFGEEFRRRHGMVIVALRYYADVIGGPDWDHPTNRKYEPVERRAKEIYDAFEYDGPSGTTKPKWEPGGNGIKQDEARDLARAELREAGHPANHQLPFQAETIADLDALTIRGGK